MNARTTLTRLLAGAASLVLAAAFGCSNSAAPSTSTTVTTPAVSVPVLITDAPADQLVSFSLTIDSITLNDASGKTASILSTPTTVEICHLNGIQAPLVTASIPQDTYTSAVITFSSPAITFINSSGQPVVATTVLAATSFTFTFPTPFTVANSNTSLLIDLLAAQSVAISGTTATVTPVFNIMPVPAATAVPPQSQNGTGMQQIAQVVSVSGTSLTLEPGSGPDFTVTTDSSTLLQGFSSLSSLTAGELVQVDFIVQSGGTLLATRIQLVPVPPNAVSANLLTGPVIALTSTGFKMALMQGLGPAVSPTAAGAIVTVTTSSSTTFAITPQFVSLSGLPFTPSFTASNLSPGQTVGVVASAFSASASTATAADVDLVPQTLGGTVTKIATAGSYTAYTLTLASGDAFTSLTGASTVTVYTSTATAPPPPSATAPPAIAVGSTVRFNGLVFNLGSGSFAMVAGCSPDAAPGV